MNPGHVHTAYHPRWLRRHVSTLWWMERASYFAFILREASCLFVAWFVAYLLLLVWAVSQGAAAYAAFLTRAGQPAVATLNIVAFAFLMYHAITFFDAAPQALVVHIGRRRVPERLIAIGHYAGWAVVSLAIFAGLVLYGG
jgi:fumarate reductase subunit C